MCKLAKYVRNCVVFWKNLHSWQKFYTTAGRDGRDKFQVWGCPHHVCSSPSRRPMPGPPNGRSWKEYRRSQLRRCWRGRAPSRWRQIITRRRTETYWTEKRRRRDTSVLELRLTINPISRRWVFKLILSLQLPSSQRRQGHPSSLSQRLPTLGLHPCPWHLSALLHLAVRCLDSSGWFAAAAILGAQL